jgi:hypothetical protein
LILAVYVAAGIGYASTAPLLDVSDEPRHFAYVQHLANGGALPVQRIGQTDAEAPWHQEGSQPPLYYALMGLLARPFDRSDFDEFWQFNPHARLGRADTTHNWNQMLHSEAGRFPWRGVALVVMLIRFASLAFGAVAVLCAYALAREFRPGDTRLPALAAALVAFNPMYLHIMGSVNNDSLATALSSLALLLGARLIRRGLAVRPALLLGIALGGAALTKASGLALSLSVPFFVLLFALRARQPLSRVVLNALAIALPAAAIAGWFYARNYVLYGDLTGTQMMAAIAGAREPAATLGEIAGEWRSFLTAYIAMFGAVNIPVPQWMYAAFEAVLVCAGAGLLLEVAAWRARRNPDAASAAIAAMSFTALIVALAALLRWTSITKASQGRLLFPIVAGLALLLATGLLRVQDSLRAAAPVRFFAPLVAGALAVLTVIAPFAYLRPAYAEPQRFAYESGLPTVLTRTELRFDDKIRWLGFVVNTPRQRVAPGEILDVTLYWQGLAPMTRNYSAFIKLFGPGDVEVLGIDTYPGGGMFQTTRWTPGEIIADRYRLRLPETMTVTMPSLLRLDVGFYDFTAGPEAGRLATFDGAGAPTGRQRYPAASLGVGGAFPPVPGVQRLSHADVVGATAALQSDGVVLIDVTWRVRRDIEADYTVFAQLFNAQGKKVGQKDGPAANGDLPARFWRAGDTVRDRRFIVPDQALVPGIYTLKFGLYRSDGALERMAAFDEAGQQYADNALRYTFEVR